MRMLKRNNPSRLSLRSGQRRLGRNSEGGRTAQPVVGCLIVALCFSSMPGLVYLTKTTSSTLPQLKVRLRNIAQQGRHRRAKQVQVDNIRNGETGSRQHLDFIIAGFPKSGTTTLLYAFQKHEELDIAGTERCGAMVPSATSARAQQQLSAAVNELTTNESIRIGIKCPTVLNNFYGLSRVQTHSPDAKLIVGVRHPVELLESFYNYRVTESHEHNPGRPIPSFVQATRAESSWNGFSMDSVRYDLYLMQLGKIGMSANEMHRLSKHTSMGVRPTGTKVFLYTLEQVKDANESTNEMFRKSLQHFLELKTPFDKFGHENTNHFVGQQAYPETVDICKAKYRKLRAKLVKQGQRTATWIQKFIRSPDVYIGNRDQFLRSIATWGTDPCESKLVTVLPLRRQRTLHHPFLY